MGTSPYGPRRRAGIIVASVLLALFLALALGACGVAGFVGDGGAVSATEANETTDTTTTVPTEPSNDTRTSESGGPDATEPAGLTTTTTSGSPATTTAGEETMEVNVYYVRDEKMAAVRRVIPKTEGVGEAAMRELMDAPMGPESAAGMVTAIPESTRLLGLDIKNGIATVDLSKEYGSGGGSLSMMLRLAQVVFTLTQFPTVQGVNFMLDGKPIDVLGGEGIIIDHPMTRADYEDMSPAILVESPTFWEIVGSPVRITGSANTFEATFRVNVVDREGLIIADQVVMATSGSGTRGTFDVTVDYPAGHAGHGTLIVFENSAKDGSPIHVVEIPLMLE